MTSNIDLFLIKFQLKREKIASRRNGFLNFLFFIMSEMNLFTFYSSKNVLKSLCAYFQGSINYQNQWKIHKNLLRKTMIVIFCRKIIIKEIDVDQIVYGCPWADVIVLHLIQFLDVHPFQSNSHSTLFYIRLNRFAFIF